MIDKAEQTNFATIRFDADLYCKAYPDVALSGLDPAYHYRTYGKMLGRHPAPPSNFWTLPHAPLSNHLIQPPTAAELQQAKNPHDLDRMFARGVVPSDAPLRHDELVSVIMPNFNNGMWIARAINSVLSQTGVNVELIVIDDGSSDESVAIAREIADNFSNVRVISLLRNFGCYYARNIGIMAAKGSFVTLLDSDDIMVPDRLSVQLDVLKSTAGAMASQSRIRRWNEDFTVPLSDLKYAENTLLWRREIIDEIGPYDTVRFGGDTEFRMRLIARYGKGALIRFTDEQYFLRTVDGSLTTQGGSQAYEVNNGELTLKLSPARQDYAKNMAAWLQSTNQPRVTFPQFSRPFALGAETQSASPSLGQRRIGTMASFPPRRDGLQASIATILPQLDELRVYLNDYPDVPDFLKHPKIRVHRSQYAVGDLRDNGKFYDLPTDDNSYIFTLDDDLLYPADYTAQLIHYIEIFERRSVVGVHGVIFPKDTNFTDLRERHVSHFLYTHPGHFVDLLGTGTSAWHSSTFRPELQDFQTKGVCDLWFAALATKSRVPLFAVPHLEGWMQVYKVFEENLFKEAQSQPQGYFDVYRDHVAPVLEQGALRLAKERELDLVYSPDALSAANITLYGPSL